MKIIESLVSSQIYVKCTKGLMYDQMYPFFFIKSFQNWNAAFVNVLAPLIHMMKKGGNALILVTTVAPFLQNSPRYLIVSNTLVDHQLFVAKLNAYMVDTKSLYFLASYLEKRKQRTKVNGS